MRYFLRRLSFYLFTLWGAITLNFFMPRMIPGNPAQAFLVRMQEQAQDPRIMQALMIDFGVGNEPLWKQYLDYLSNLFQGNLGLSVTHYPTPVSEVIAQSLPWTIVLVGVSTIISFILGTGIGIFVAWKRGSWMDQGLMPALLFFAALPSFWVALVIIYFLAFQMGWFPLGGGYDSNIPIDLLSWDFLSSAIYYSILPAFTIVLFSYAGWVLGMRNLMILNLNEDYIVMAQAKGLPERRIMFAYAARNAMLPVITSFALALGSVIGGSVLVENIFSYPGMGSELVKAIGNLDYASIQSFAMLIIVATLVANFIVDLLYMVLDPRVRRA